MDMAAGRLRSEAVVQRRSDGRARAERKPTKKRGPGDDTVTQANDSGVNAAAAAAGLRVPPNERGARESRGRSRAALGGETGSKARNRPRWERVCCGDETREPAGACGRGSVFNVWCCSIFFSRQPPSAAAQWKTGMRANAHGKKKKTHQKFWAVNAFGTNRKRRQ